MTLNSYPVNFKLRTITDNIVFFLSITIIDSNTIFDT